jgi:EAL domain-containing protein (putative c-di-GMP-specific phosphodiesterase class I)
MSTSAQTKSFVRVDKLGAACGSATPATLLAPPKQCLASPQSASCLPTDADVIHAITAGAGLRLVYQPQYDLRTMRMTGAEAQLRWQHPVYGNIPLSVLAPMAHRLGLHMLLLNFVVTQAIDVLCYLRRFDESISLSVHAPACTVCAPGIATFLSNRMSRAGLPSQLLTIDLREDLAVFDAPRLLACLGTLRTKSIPLSLKVFDASPATRNLLSTMLFDEVRIDAGLIHAEEHTSVRAMASLFKLKLHVQGIDNDAMIAPLRRIGCGTGQGQALSCPLERVDFLKNKMSKSAL